MLELISEFIKAIGIEINEQKSVAFLYTKNEPPERKIKKIILFPIGSKTIKIGINLSKEVKDLYTENYKILMKETEDSNRWKDILCPWIGILILLLIKGYFSQIGSKSFNLHSDQDSYRNIAEWADVGVTTE